MSLRSKIVLLSIMAAIGMVFGLWREFHIYQAHSETISRLRTNLAVVATLSDAIHQLQQERGLSTIGRISGNDQALTQQYQQTDRALASLSLPKAELSQILQRLELLRQSFADKTADALRLRDSYRSMIRDLIAQIITMTFLPGAEGIHAGVTLHADMLQAKETLGLIRATVGYWIVNPGAKDQVYLDLVRLLSQYDASRDRIEFEADPQLKRDFLAFSDEPGVQEVMAIIRHIEASGQPPANLQVIDWWTRITAVIDRLKLVVDQSRQSVERTAEQRIDALEMTFYREATITICLSMIVFGLALSATFSLLTALGRALNGLNQISASADFSSRLDVKAKDEIARISHKFNNMLDIAERLIAEKDYLASTDPLTGINNRLHFNQMIRIAFERKRRHPGPLSLVLLDVDHFKKINDSFGHNLGDEVLRGLASLIASNLRQTDVLARWGGEEFILLLPDDDVDGAVKLAEKLRSKIAAHRFAVSRQVTCSFGIATWQPEDTQASLIDRADQALYRAKGAGRNRITVYQPPATA